MKKSVLITMLVGMALLLVNETVEAVNIRGVRSCGVWVQDRNKEQLGDGGLSLDNQTWLIGYLSGMAIAMDKEFWGKQGVNVLDNQSVYLWIDNYCRANPLKDLGDAGVELFLEQIRRTGGK